MNSIFISIGKISITWYSIFILLGVLLATFIIKKEANKNGIPTSFVTNLVFWCVFYGIIGARIYYVLFNLDYYSINPGLITFIIYCKKYEVNVLKMLDISVPGLILAQAIGRWGNFFNSEAYGGMVSRAFLENLHIPNFIIKGMYINGSYYHPTFFYESLFCFIGFFVLIGIRSLKGTKVGTTTSIYLIWYGILRFFIESLRTDSLMLSSIKMAQLVSILMVILGIVLLIISKNKCKEYSKEVARENEIKF